MCANFKLIVMSAQKKEQSCDVSQQFTTYYKLLIVGRLIRSAYSILPPMVVNVYVAYIVYRILRVVVIPT